MKKLTYASYHDEEDDFVVQLKKEFEDVYYKNFNERESKQDEEDENSDNLLSDEELVLTTEQLASALETHVQARKIAEEEDDEKHDRNDNALRHGKDVWALCGAAEQREKTCQDGVKMDEKQVKEMLHNATAVALQDDGTEN